MKVFDIANLVAGYDEHLVLNNISLTIQKGEFVSLAGPNGSGKSTMLKTLLAYLHPKQGTINLYDRDIRAYSGIEMAGHISFVQQHLEYIAPRTVREFVTLGRFPHKKYWEPYNKDDRKLVAAALEFTDTKHLQERNITELSGGELQLICIARALAQTKEIILLDEPTSNLDLKHTLQIMDLLYELNRAGSTIIFVSHDINLALSYTSRIVGLKEGRVVFDLETSACTEQKNFEELYNVSCSVEENKITGRPMVMLHPQYTYNDVNEDGEYNVMSAVKNNVK